MLEILWKYFEQKDLDLLLDLAAYNTITENNASQYYPDYAYNHFVLTRGMTIYSGSTVLRFLQEITLEQSIGFLNEWNEGRDHRDKI